jgi:hypothetical protein
MRQFSTVFLFLFCITLSRVHAETYGVSISSDGKTYAILQDLQEQRVVVFYNAEDPTAKPKAFGLGDVATEEFYMAGPDHALVRVTGIKRKVPLVSGLTEIEFSRWFSVDRLQGDIEMLFENQTGQDYGFYLPESGELLATLPEAKEAIFSRLMIRAVSRRPTRMKEGRDEQVYGLHRLELENSKTRRLAMGDEDTLQWIVDENGDDIAYVNSANDKWKLFRTKGNASELVTTVDYDTDSIKRVWVLGRAHEDGYLIARVKDSDDQWGYRRVNLSTGAIESGNVPLFGRIEYEVYDPRTARAHAIIQGGKVHHFNPADTDLQNKLEKGIAGAAILVDSASSDRTRFIIRAMYPEKPTEWYLLDRNTNNLELIAAN